MPSSRPRYRLLDELRFVEVGGSESASFLNAQLSIDITQLGDDRAPLAAWHTPKGRVRALVRVVPAAGEWLLVTPAGTEQTLCRQLGMYVLRADVRIAEAPDRRGAAVLGAEPEWLAARGVDLPPGANAAAAAGDLVWIRVGPDVVYALAPSDAPLDPIRAHADEASADELELAEIRLGLPRIGPDLVDKYLPQMLNLDALGAVAYDKGCYPGQEVIARTHNLGSVKRRLARFTGRGARVPQPGDAVIDAEGDEVGEIVRAAASGDGFEVLSVVRLAALDGALDVAAGSKPAGGEADDVSERLPITPA